MNFFLTSAKEISILYSNRPTEGTLERFEKRTSRAFLCLFIGVVADLAITVDEYCDRSPFAGR